MNKYFYFSWVLIATLLSSSSFGKSPLHYAVQHRRNAEVLELLALGADVNESDEYNYREDEYGVLCRNPRVYNSGWTALHYAAFMGFPELVALLLERGAHEDNRLATGETALDITLYHLVLMILDPQSRFTLVKQHHNERFEALRLQGHEVGEATRRVVDEVIKRDYVNIIRQLLNARAAQTGRVTTLTGVIELLELHFVGFRARLGNSPHHTEAEIEDALLEAANLVLNEMRDAVPNLREPSLLFGAGSF